MFVNSMDNVIEGVSQNKSLVYLGSYYHLLHVSAGQCNVKVIEDKTEVPKWLGILVFCKQKKVIKLIFFSICFPKGVQTPGMDFDSLEYRGDKCQCFFASSVQKIRREKVL